ncbi:hypothetical protein ACJX0J_029018 [Zea mays]
MHTMIYIIIDYRSEHSTSKHMGFCLIILASLKILVYYYKNCKIKAIFIVVPIWLLHLKFLLIFESSSPIRKFSFYIRFRFYNIFYNFGDMFTNFVILRSIDIG